MKRFIAKHLIVKAIDAGSVFPAWVVRYMANDVELTRFANDQRQLVSRLRGEAKAWIDARAESGVNPAPSHSVATQSASANREQPLPRHRSLAMVTMAVCLVGGVVFMWNRGSTQPVPGPVGPEPTAAFEMENVQEAFERSERAINKIVVHANDLATAVGPEERPLIGKLTREYVERAGSIYGKSLVMLNQRR